MATYVISGVWKDSNGIITHYAFHTDDERSKTIGPVIKKAKADAVRTLDGNSNSAKTLVWDYTSAEWRTGEDVYVAGTGVNKFLKSKPDNSISDNLGHLVCWNELIH